MSKTQNYIDVLLPFLKKAGRLAITKQNELIASDKDDGSIVTETDLAISNMFQEVIKENFKNHSILDEETALKEVGLRDKLLQNEYIWVIDPIDGTKTYYHGSDLFALALSLYRNKNVALIGKSETAYNEAIYLSSLCDKVTIISEDEINFAPLKNYNNIVLKEKNNLKLIEKEKNLVKKIITDKEIIDVDAVFVYNGYEPKTDFVKGIKLKNGYIIVNKNMQSSNKDIYACGDIILKDIYQITTAVSEATIAAINVKKELS